jgi:hypothetical protein
MADLLPDVAHYGDIAKLKAMSTGVKKTGGVYGATVQRNPVGRPQGSSSAAAAPAVAPQAAPQPNPQIPPEHLALMDNYARAKAAAIKWQGFAQSADAGPWVQFYAQVAQRQLDQAAIQLKGATPDYLG